MECVCVCDSDFWHFGPVTLSLLCGTAAVTAAAYATEASLISIRKSTKSFFSLATVTLKIKMLKFNHVSLPSQLLFNPNPNP